MTMTIFHAPFARSVRAIWLCEEIGAPYQVKEVALDKTYLQSPEYLAVNPLGKIPALIDGDMAMFESIAIMEYILAKYPNSIDRHKDDDEFAAYLQWLHFGEATFGLCATMALAHTKLLPEKLRNEGIVKWATIEAHKCFNALAVPLDKHDFLLPSGFSAADISVGYMLLLAKFAGLLSGAPEPVVSYLAELTSRPGWNIATGRK